MFVTCVMCPGDGQAAGTQRRVRSDDAEEAGTGGEHRGVFQQTGSCREADRRTGRREGALDGEHAAARREILQHHRRRAAQCRRGRLPGRFHRQLQTGE